VRHQPPCALRGVSGGAADLLSVAGLTSSGNRLARAVPARAAGLSAPPERGEEHRPLAPCHDRGRPPRWELAPADVAAEARAAEPAGIDRRGRSGADSPPMVSQAGWNGVQRVSQRAVENVQRISRRQNSGFHHDKSTPPQHGPARQSTTGRKPVSSYSGLAMMAARFPRGGVRQR
jgi:hypothetical protein